MRKKVFYAMAFITLFGMASCEENDEPLNDNTPAPPGASESVSDTITIDLDALSSPTIVAETIWDAYGQGYTKFVLKGSYEKLGCFDDGNWSGELTSPFAGIERLSLIDLSGVTGFPEIEVEPGVFMRGLNADLGDYLYELRLPEEVEVLVNEIDSYVMKLSIPGVVRAMNRSLVPASLYSVDAPKLESIEGGIGLANYVSCLSFPRLTAFGDAEFGWTGQYNAINIDTLKLTAPGTFTLELFETEKDPYTGEDRITAGTFYGLNSESCTLFLNRDKKPNGGGTPIANGNEWAGETWKEIIFTDNNGNIAE